MGDSPKSSTRMTETLPDASDSAEPYCSALVRDNDEDFFLSSRYAAAPDRLRQIALFALQTELRRIPHIVSEPPLGEIRLQWFRDALDEIASGAPVRAHPTTQTIAAAGLVDAASRADLERLIDARARLLYEPRFSSVDDLKGFLAEAEAPLAMIAARGTTHDARSLRRLAEAHALARFAPMLAPELAADACAMARRELQEAAQGAPPVSAGLAGRIAYLGLARGYAQRPDARPWPLGKRLALFQCVMSGRF